MKFQKIFSFAFILMLSLILVGCGGGGAGAPGSTGSDDIGVMIEAFALPYYGAIEWTISNEERPDGTLSTIVYSGNFTDDVDVTQIIDCDPSTADVAEIEPFFDHRAFLVINVRLLNPNSPFKPGTLFITEYKVDYFRSTDSLTAPPIESDRRFTSMIINLTSPSVGSGNRYFAETVMLIDLPRKFKYVEMMDSGRYTSHPSLINNYTAEYTFYGKDSYGKSFTFKVRKDFSMGSYDYCGLLQ